MASGLFVAAVAIRLAALAILGLTPQTFEYEDQAASLLAGQGYRHVHLGTSYYAFGFPPFGFICAALYRVFGHHPLPVILVQVAASALIPVVIARIAGMVGLDGRLALVAGALAAVHPGLVVYSVGKLHPLSLDALLISLVVLSVMRLSAAAGFGAYLLAGGLLGLTALSRPTMGLFAVPAAVWIAWASRERSRRHLVLGLVLFLVSVPLAVLPWTVRNYVVLHRFVPITTSNAEVFWIGNNPIATGSTLLADGRSILAGAPEAFRRELWSRDELGQVDLFREAARTFVREHPGAFVGLVWRKWLSFWWFPATAGLLYPARWLVIYKMLYASVLSAVLLGVAACWGQADQSGRQRLILVLAVLCHVSVLQSLFYVDVRHRWSVEPLLGIFLAFAVGWWRRPDGQQGRALDEPAAAA